MATPRAGGLGWAAEPKVSGPSPPHTGGTLAATHMSPRSRSRGLSIWRLEAVTIASRGPARLLHNQPMRIEVVESVSPELAEAISSLLPQLSSASPPSASELARIVDSP